MRGFTVKIAENKDFEHRYLQKFKQIASGYAEFIEYENDCAAIDLGLQFTLSREGNGGKVVTPARSWVQLKGITNKKLPLSSYDENEELSLTLEVSHLQFWFHCEGPVYIVVYVECIDEFFVFNIVNWINEKYGEKIYDLEQKTKKVSFHKRNKLDSNSFERMRVKSTIPSIMKAFNVSESEAFLIMRDDQIIKKVYASSLGGNDVRCVYKDWISKCRSEFYFEEFVDGEWKSIRKHWEWGGDLEGSFPYLNFDNFEDIEIDSFDFNENELDELYLEKSKKTVFGEGGWTGEFREFVLKPSLDKASTLWAERIKQFEKLDLTVVSDEPAWISIAPFHVRDL